MSGQRDGVLHRAGSLVQKQFAAASHGFSFRLLNWLHRKKNGCPTGYQHTQIDPDCQAQIRQNWKAFISETEVLRAWLTALRPQAHGLVPVGNL
ncbi:MAG UNVERIFIED_CONTAM: hypothetical protein LVR18_33515 [Planctomycetaceae bacterium]